MEEVDDWVSDLLDEATKRRNLLIHEHFLKPSDKIAIVGKKFAMPKELIGIKAHSRRGTEPVQGMRVAKGER